MKHKDLETLRKKVVKAYFGYAKGVADEDFCKAFGITEKQLKAFVGLTGQNIASLAEDMEEPEGSIPELFAAECNDVLEAEMGISVEKELLDKRRSSFEMSKYRVVQLVLSLQMDESTSARLAAMEKELRNEQRLHS